MDGVIYVADYRILPKSDDKGGNIVTRFNRSPFDTAHFGQARYSHTTSGRHQQ